MKAGDPTDSEVRAVEPVPAFFSFAELFRAPRRARRAESSSAVQAVCAPHTKCSKYASGNQKYSAIIGSLPIRDLLSDSLAINPKRKDEEQLLRASQKVRDAANGANDEATFSQYFDQL